MLDSSIDRDPLTSFISLLTLTIAISASMGSYSTPFVHLAHTRLTSPLPYIHALFGPVDSAKTWKEDGLELFSSETDVDRLDVGPVSAPDGELAFGVARAPEPRFKPTASK